MLEDSRISRYLYRVFDALPSPFAQLAFLTSLRDPYTGHYLHEGWASISSPATVNLALRETHQDVFGSVVDLSLIDLSKELRKHFKSLGEVERRAATLWLETEPYYEMIPEGSSQLCRRFFISQVRFALELLVHAPSWECLEAPTSSPLQPPAPTPRPHFVN
jgi:hypothetical protein